MLDKKNNKLNGKPAAQSDEGDEASRGPPRLKVCYAEGRKQIQFEVFFNTIGTNNSDFAVGLMHQLIAIATVGGKLDETKLNFVRSVVTELQPKDHVEAMLAVQMAAVHLATVTFAERLAHVNHLAQLDSVERALNKLARTFVNQVEALKRYRTGGEQKVTVEHVTVNKGGQAVVGNVHAGAAANMKPDESPSPHRLGDQSGATFNVESGTRSAKLRMGRKR
jgi:hypothetical protein